MSEAIRGRAIGAFIDLAVSDGIEMGTKLGTKNLRSAAINMIN